MYYNFNWTGQTLLLSDPPSTNSTTLSKQRNDTLTHDTWHMTCDTWWGVHILSNLSSLALTVWNWQCLKDSERKDDSMNERIIEIIYYKGVYRTAPATLGLLKTNQPIHISYIWIYINQNKTKHLHRCLN